MTSPEQPDKPSEPTYADRVYRSPLAMVGGALLLALALWMGGDALIRGEGRTKLLAVATLLLVVPLVVAFTFRPAVFANDDRMRVRNPFRTIVLPWSSVVTLRAQYSTEAVIEDGTKYQLWSVPVSLRERKLAARGKKTTPADADRTVQELRELAETGATRPTAKGEPTVTWAYEIIAPAVVGAIALATLLATG
ncbi:PH domain-containing protein [Streptomyces sp. NPDC047928]|uniref:PH domain-containing protein n=1 Tax=unclassified Streptomyces TaxID=2593676 RepID=UPI00371D973F